MPWRSGSKLYGQAGRVVYDAQASDQHRTFIPAQTVPGIYYLRVWANGEMYGGKVVQQ